MRRERKRSKRGKEQGCRDSSPARVGRLDGSQRSRGWLDGGFEGVWVAAGDWAARIPKKIVAVVDTKWVKTRSLISRVAHYLYYKGLG